MATELGRLKSLIASIGRAAVHAKFPNDFEYYVMQFELTDSRGVTIDSLVLPVNPKSFSFSEKKNTSVRKTLGGVTALSNQTFNPKTISLSGSFGRKLKVLLIPQEGFSEDSVGKGIFSNVTAGLRKATPAFSAKVKSGYGTMKMFEAMLEKAQGLDEFNRPRSLYFYNSAFNQSFLVKVNQVSFSQDVGQNMIWQYKVDLTAIAEAEVPDSKVSQFTNNTAMGILQRKANALASSFRRDLF